MYIMYIYEANILIAGNILTTGNKKQLRRLNRRRQVAEALVLYTRACIQVCNLRECVWMSNTSTSYKTTTHDLFMIFRNNTMRCIHFALY